MPIGKWRFNRQGNTPPIWISRPKIRRFRRSTEKVRRRAILTKRRKFVVVSVLLSLGLFGIQILPVEARYLAIAAFAVMSYFLSAWSVRRDLRGIEWLSILILPTLYPVSVALFYFLLPQDFLVRIVVNVVFAITMYALLLTANIFAVASIRTIQLLRAARAVGFLLTILTSAFLFHVIFALRLPAVVVGALVFVCSMLLYYQGVWSHTLSLKGEKKELVYTLIGSAIMLEVGLAMSFWLLDVALASIMLAMVVYVVLGMFQQDLEKRLFTRTIQEYVGFATIVFVVIVTTVMARWMN